MNPFKGTDGPEGASVPWSPYGRMLDARPAFTLDPRFHAGCYYVQDSSAMFAGHVFRKYVPERCFRVLDLCAAPGGKTTDLAASLRERFGDDFLLVANEVMRERSRVLLDNLAIWGDPNVVVTGCDPAAFAALPGYFDAIVADVPCSGEGMFRKDPKAEEQWSPALVDLCAKRQRRILSDVFPALRQGGLLVYSTCTYEDRENDENLEWTAAELGGEILPPSEEFGSSGVRTTRSGNLLHDGEVPGEGQWVGAMLKTSPSGSSSRDYNVLRPLRSGVCKGEMRGRDFVPSADYALSIGYDGCYPEVDVDLDTALHFLHRDSLVLKDVPTGYLVLKYRGHRLGFVKNIGSRCNNLHPMSRRILKTV